MSTIGKVSSFAVLDLETTNLPDYNFNKANITEVSIHGFSVEDVRNAKTIGSLRVNHKLTLLFNPLMPIHPTSEEITGLDNYMLEKESPFDKNSANVIISFLKHLKQPVCLVAHNGYHFDFPIFKQAFDKLGMELPSNVMCIDTLVAIKELDRLTKEQGQKEISASQESNAEIPLPDIHELMVVTNPESDKEEKEKPADRQKLNETTPKRSANILLTSGRKCKQIIERRSPVQKFKSRRSLFKTPNQRTSTPNNFGQYKLGNIYRRLFDEVPEVTHHAEADVIILKKIMLQYGELFVEYVESNATLFADVKKVGTS